ncbi:Wzz/FepE/Etk N-terminal domain-containing protein [Streptomyces sp. KLOTTS4A1]|uniref:Wzz/FepE/Etk N-terminal domain-containing protein n=1 Tax=Streptomyces sp. KLOTTS4A1 TaxID=3390996 RepID=UPI0039F5C9D2
MTAQPPAEPTSAAPLLDLQALVVAVRRRRRLWFLLGVLGLLAGATVAVVLPPPPTAVTTVLVAHEADQPSDPGTLIKTDAALLGTTRIADRALRSLDPAERPGSAEDFMEDYEGRGLTNNLLQIEVRADSEELAEARASALADAFIDDHVRRLREAADAEAKSLLSQRDLAQDQLADVNQQIGAAPPQSDPEAAADLESLYARRAELTARIAEFEQRAEEARMGTPRLVAGTLVVDAARVVEHSLPTTAATNAAIGLVLGLVLGLALAAVGAVVRDRPVLRREIAAHLGASVIAELPRRLGGRWELRRTRAARARLTVSLARQVRGRSEPVSLLELGAARPTGTLALQLADALAADEQVVIVDGLPDRRLARRKQRPGTPTVVGGERAETLPAGLRRIGVGSVAPGTAWTDLSHLGSRTVLVVRAGHGGTAWLHTVARQLADQQIEVLGVVLIDPDPRDRSDGTLWDGHRPAPRTRIERLARQNGTDPRRVKEQVLAGRAADGEQEEH